MRNSSSLRRRTASVVAVVAALALSAVAAGSASAATEWVQGETSMKWSGSGISLTLNGGSKTTCSLTSATGEPEPFLYEWGAVQSLETGQAVGGVNNLSGPFAVGTRLSCEGGKSFELCACVSNIKKVSTGVYQLTDWNKFAGWSWAQSPYGEYVVQEAVKGTFTNGAGATPSTLKFENVLMGYGPGEIRMTGTFTVTTIKGGLLTLKG
jgi:hypothetical protein